MTTAKVLAKGQVVIPKDIRGKMGIAPGDRVELKLVQEGVILRPLRKNATEKFRGIVKGRLSLEELESFYAEKSGRL
jgi:AbrB family looped-hinge helix DNA binding protein